MRKALNTKAIEAFKPKLKRYEVHDLLCPGFSLRIYPTGRKVFSLKARVGLKQRRLQLGIFPRVTLTQAREKALEALRLVDEGIDPVAPRRQLSMRVEAVVDDFIRQYAKPRNRSWKETERILKRELVAAYGEMDIRKIKRADIFALMDAAIERGSPYQANRIFAQIRILMRWAVERGIIDASPINGARAPVVETKRRRVLDDDEIKRVLIASAQLPYPYRYVVPMLLATATRRSEVANLRWSELDLENKIWTLPAERSKNGEEYTVPLSAFAMRILEELPRFEGSDIVFTTNGKSPINGFSKFLKRLQAASGTSGWRLHDLRRTAASGMARAKVEPHVISKVLNHISSTNSVTWLYIRHQFEDEKRAALDTWGKWLEDLNPLS